MSPASEKESAVRESDEKATPFLTVVKGAPSDEEIAALTVVLASAGAGGEGPDHTVVDRWGRASDLHRQAWGMPTSYIHRG